MSVCEFVAAGDFLWIIYREANNNLYCEADRLLRIITATDLCHNVLCIANIVMMIQSLLIHDGYAIGKEARLWL